MLSLLLCFVRRLLDFWFVPCSFVSLCDSVSALSLTDDDDADADGPTSIAQCVLIDADPPDGSDVAFDAAFVVLLLLALWRIFTAVQFHLAASACDSMHSRRCDADVAATQAATSVSSFATSTAAAALSSAWPTTATARHDQRPANSSQWLTLVHRIAVFVLLGVDLMTLALLRRWVVLLCCKIIHRTAVRTVSHFTVLLWNWQTRMHIHKVWIHPRVRSKHTRRIKFGI